MSPFGGVKEELNTKATPHQNLLKVIYGNGVYRYAPQRYPVDKKSMISYPHPHRGVDNWGILLLLLFDFYDTLMLWIKIKYSNL